MEDLVDREFEVYEYYVTITISIPTALKGRFDTKCVGLLFIYYWIIIKTLWMKESHDLFPPPHPLNASPLKFTFYPPAENHLNDCCLGIIPFSPLPESKNWHIWGLGSAQWYMVTTHGHQLIEMDTFTPGKTNYNYMLDLGFSLYNQCNNLSQSWLCSEVKCVLQSPTMPFLEISNDKRAVIA